MLIEAAPARVTTPILQVLREARDRIADPRHWTTDAAARDEHGTKVLAIEPSAVQWCAIGAIGASDGSAVRFGDVPVHILARHALSAAIPFPMSVGEFNDYSSHEQVLAMFDRAIAAQEAAC